MGRRFRSQPQTQIRISSRKLVCFQLGSEHYAIPIEQVQRIVDEFTSQGILNNGISLAEFNNETITLIDLSTLFLSSADTRERSYLIICNFDKNTRFGIPIPEMPTILQVTEDKFEEVPDLYKQGKLSVAVERIIHTPEDRIVFYLNLARLIEDVYGHG